MKLLLLSISVIFLTTACSEQNGRTAPLKESDLGVIINLHQDEVSTKFTNTKPITKSKILPFTEVMDVSVEEVKAAFPDALVSKNTFVKSNHKKNTVSDSNLIKSFSNEETEESFSLQGCVHNPLALQPKINIVDEVNTPRFLTKNDKLLLTSRNSKAANGESFQTAWAVVAPKGSLIKTKLILSQEIEVGFDMAGVYEINLFSRQGINCNIQRIPLPVTANPEFNNQDNTEESLNPFNSLSMAMLKNTPLAQRELMGVPAARERSRKGKGVVVAVLDSGVNYNSPLLAGKIWQNPNETKDGTDTDGNQRVDDIIGYDFVNDDPYPMDDGGHGSHVAGLIAGDIVGIATNAKIMPVKVMHGLGFSDTGTILSGLVYAILNGADVVNMSLGGPGISPNLVNILLSVYAEAEKRDVIIVAASGNGDPETGLSANIDSNPIYPASLAFNNILTVGSSDLRGDMTYYSNYGVKSVDVLAFGGMDFDIKTRKPVNELVTSAYISNPSGILTQDTMGTSMAAPIVAGMVALLRGEDGNLSAPEVNQMMIDSVDLRPELEGVIKSSGVVNVEKALDLLVARLIN